MPPMMSPEVTLEALCVLASLEIPITMRITGQYCPMSSKYRIPTFLSRNRTPTAMTPSPMIRPPAGFGPP